MFQCFINEDGRRKHKTQRGGYKKPIKNQRKPDRVDFKTIIHSGAHKNRAHTAEVSGVLEKIIKFPTTRPQWLLVDSLIIQNLYTNHTHILVY